MEDLKLLSEKLDVSVVACVRYSPWGGLPKMAYLKTECGVWYTYYVTSPPLTQEACSTFETFMVWIETDHGDDWWVYTLGDMVVDENTIEDLNSLLTTQSN